MNKTTKQPIAKHKVTRRKLLLALCALPPALGGAYFLNKTMNNAKQVDNLKRFLLQALQEELPYLDLKQATTDLFYEEIKNNFYLFRPLNQLYADPLSKHHQKNIAKTFLLSTDFFYKEQPTAVQYLGINSPYQRPCQNPFADLS